MSEAEQAADRPIAVAVVRSGGIAGIRRTWQIEPPTDVASRWVALIERCPWDDPAPARRGADLYTWSIRARVAGRECAREIPDAELSGPWRVLVDAVQTAAKA
ncbi:protealysin inhibitor emfourin [Microbacterium sp. cx-59]|uniref:protealysin inhibitor emfourin n=1 Tax=Microbacterium sp. cx-59 TaxID=2891207 RepID=UPI001E5CC160|nr:protealysin inhibitor emfourin [Microbacterium sp. cx-59]MCC4907538.1 hypothetical protein [Microbacterium sp. cx-59]